MRKSLLSMAAAVAVGLGAPAAHASIFLFQWDDAETALTGTTYKDGQVIQSIVVGDEAYANGYGLWDGALMAIDVDLRVNVYEPRSNVVSDTWRIQGHKGNQSISIPFFSDFNNQLPQPLPDAIKLFETGEYQTVLEFDVNNGDHYIWQFRSDVDAVPEPETYALMLGGLGVLAFVARRRKA